MGVPHLDVVASYLRYKEGLLDHYSNLITNENSHSIKKLISKLKDIENKHKHTVLSNQAVEGHLGAGICEQMALTPTHELHLVSEKLNELMSFRSNCLNEFLSSLDASEEDVKELVEKIKIGEMKLQSDIGVERHSCRL